MGDGVGNRITLLDGGAAADFHGHESRRALPVAHDRLGELDTDAPHDLPQRTISLRVWV